MISFVWSSKWPFYAGTGGSENYTAGQIRELKRRGIDARIITIGHGTYDGREDFPDIEFMALKSKEELSMLDDNIVFVLYPLSVETKHQASVVLHIPPPTYTQPDSLFDPEGIKGKKLIVTSKAAARMWRRYLSKSITIPRIHIVYPFAETAFSKVKRSSKKAKKPVKMLFAGRLHPEKGIYTLLAALHMHSLKDINLELTATTAGMHSEEGQIIHKLLQAHPNVNVVPARKTPTDMARLMADHDIVLMPTTGIFWQETFGIISVEAQHAGCRVVASRAGGLPETDCGGLMLVKPDNPKSLANGIAKAAKMGPLTSAERLYASNKFTVKSSVDALLKVITLDQSPRKGQLRVDAKLFPGLAPRLNRFGHHLRQAASVKKPKADKQQTYLKN